MVHAAGFLLGVSRVGYVVPTTAASPRCGCRCGVHRLCSRLLVISDLLETIRRPSCRYLGESIVAVLLNPEAAFGQAFWRCAMGVLGGSFLVSSWLVTALWGSPAAGLVYSCWSLLVDWLIIAVVLAVMIVEVVAVVLVLVVVWSSRCSFTVGSSTLTS